MAPVNVKILSTQGPTCVISWNPIPCLYQNGKIRSYLIVFYYELPSGEVVERQTLSSGHQRQYTITDLRNNTCYNFMIAGVNNAGVGKFSTPITYTTPGGKCNRWV